MTMTFEEACQVIALREKVVYETVATKRQRSKWNNGYGRATLVAGLNTRPQPKPAA